MRRSTYVPRISGTPLQAFLGPGSWEWGKGQHGKRESRSDLHVSSCRISTQEYIDRNFPILGPDYPATQVAPFLAVAPVWVGP